VPGPVYPVVKRAFDVAAAGVGLVVLSPILLVIAGLVKLDSPGPAFYRGVRTGRHGVPFRIFKFRTMVVDAERRGGGSTAHNDPRITRVGRVLRRYKLDELPQVLNVLRGDMSVVGPRPELPEYTGRYSDEERAILSVRPGITDHASVRFVNLGEQLGSEDADRVYEERVLAEKNRLRLEYVRRQSFLGDLRIVLRTLGSVVSGRGE
jgi:lipopolysaccharide/colanic/teichoic acid biosynthesis glycosyltransferase